MIEDRFSISVNVSGYNESEKESPIYLVYISKKNYNGNMDLLIISDEKSYEECDTIEDCKNKSHYVYIKHFDRLMTNKSKYDGKKYFCKRCLLCFSSERVLNNHIRVCLMINGEQSVKMGEGSISFTNHSRQIPVPFKIYADFECILEKVDSEAKRSRANEVSEELYQNHVPCGYSYKLVCVDDKFTEDTVVYRGKDWVRHFINQILITCKYCKKIKKHCFNKNLLMTKEDERKFQASDKSWFCEKLFDEADIKVRDHCHISGKFRGAAHQSCNINLKMTNRVLVIFHNLRGYDSHLIFKELSNFDVDINVIPNGLEKYMAFIINKNLIFIDSMQFMNSSLDSLIKNLSDSDFKHLSNEFKDTAQLELVKQKGVYPYEYMHCSDKFDKRELPSKRQFYSTLKCVGISGEEYERAKKLWNVFKMENMGDYHDLYLKTDVLLLCDVFEKFINTCSTYYGLDPCHYFSAPGLSWDAMLKMTCIKLDCISDIDMQG